MQNSNESGFSLTAVSLILALLLLGAAFVFVAKVEAVRNGSPGIGGQNWFPKTVFAVVNQDTEPPGFIANASNIVYPRCMLTSKLVANYPLPLKIKEGLDAASTTAKQQDFQSSVTYDVIDVPLEFDDVAIVWVKNKSGTPSTPRLQDPVDYAPSPIDKAGNFGPLPKPTTLVGYGAFSGSNSGVGKKRLGQPETVAYLTLLGLRDNDLWYVGSFHTIPRPADNNRIGCVGDAGASFASTGYSNVYGVLAGASSSTCSDVTWNKYAAFAWSSVYPEKNTYDWVTHNVANLCGKTLNAGVFIGLGNVTGILNAVGPSYPNEVALNHQINCPDGNDCTERIHAGELMTLYAQPAFGYVFDKWTSDPGITPLCPCHNSTNPTCNAAYGDIGYYDANISDDSTLCYADFVLQ